jgi:hypothetical protein
VIPPEEMRHLTAGPRAGEMPGGAGLVVIEAESKEGHAVEILERAREVLTAVLTHIDGPWPTIEQWKQLLPAWFVESSAAGQSDEEVERWLERWRGLSAAERAREESLQPWTLADWLYWLEPHERQWYWWDAEIAGPDKLRVSVEVPGWPAPLGSLDWLLRASGADEVRIVEPEGI